VTPLLFLLTTFGVALIACLHGLDGGIIVVPARRGRLVVWVATSIAVFAAEHDGVYVAITSVVLLLLILSFVIGAGG